MTNCFKITNKEEKDGHQWLILDIADDKWLDHLSKIYKELRIATEIPIPDIDYNGLKISAENIRKKLIATQIPERGKGNFAVPRSDFGETIAYTILDELFSTRFGYKSLRDRELIQLPGRGIDAIGVELHGDKIILILGEVKCSSDQDSPPSVVDKGKDCLKNQHTLHLENLKETASKIMQAARRAKDAETQQLLMTGAMLIDEKDGLEKISLTIYSCLVRQSDKFTENDFGSFKKNPEGFKPSAIRFTIMRVPGELEQAVDEWLQLAQSEEIS